MYIYIKTLKKDEELLVNPNIPKIIQKIIIKFKKIFNIITIKKIDEKHYLYIMPKESNLEKVVLKNKKEKIILSKELKKYENQFDIQNKDIYYFIPKILQYIMKEINKKLELQNIFLLVDKYNEKNLEIIKYLIDKVRTVNIITSSVEQYKKLEEKLFNENGTLITVTNNKNKSLKRANFIINIDFSNQNIGEYKISPNAIIINCTNEKIETLKYFQGIIINKIEINLQEKENLKEFYQEFEKIDIYNSLEMKPAKYIENIRQIEQDEIKIKNLIGNNGIIDKKELLNMQKILTNYKN